MGMNEIYRRIKAFRRRLEQNSMNGLPKLYFCKIDVVACFDNIDHGTLLTIVNEILKQVIYQSNKCRKNILFKSTLHYTQSMGNTSVYFLGKQILHICLEIFRALLMC